MLKCIMKRGKIKNHVETGRVFIFRENLQECDLEFGRVMKELNLEEKWDKRIGGEQQVFVITVPTKLHLPTRGNDLNLF